MLQESRDGATAILTLDYPERRNALAVPMREKIVATMERLESDPTLRAIVLTGSGAHFSAGGDISGMNVTDFAAGRERFRTTHKLVKLFIESSKPIISAVEGWCVGAGMGLALCCDTIIAAADARFMAGFGKIGLIDQITPPGTALQTALTLATTLATAAPLPIAMTKSYLAQGLADALEWERNTQSMMFLTADHAEGKAAFLGKRAPEFKGK